MLGFKIICVDMKLIYNTIDKFYCLIKDEFNDNFFNGDFNSSSFRSREKEPKFVSLPYDKNVSERIANILNL